MAFSFAPTGYAMVAPTLMHIASFVLSIIVIVSCTLIRATSRSYQSNTGETISGTSVGFGLFSHESFKDTDSDKCYDYTRSEKDIFYDGAMKFSAAMGCIAAAFGGITMLFLFVSFCAPFSKCGFVGLGLMIMLTGAFQALSLSAFGSDICTKSTYEDIDDDNFNQGWIRHYRDCELGSGGVMATVAAGMWLAGGLFVSVAGCCCSKKRVDDVESVKEVVEEDEKEAQEEAPVDEEEPADEEEEVEEGTGDEEDPADEEKPADDEEPVNDEEAQVEEEPAPKEEGQDGGEEDAFASATQSGKVEGSKIAETPGDAGGSSDVFASAK